MIVDASAIVAIMRDEVGGDDLADRLAGSRTRSTHPISVYEATLAIARLAGSQIAPAGDLVLDFLAEMKIERISLSPSDTAAALDAFARYGKGRHPASLNMGDCFSYACAKLRGMPLLYKGADFALTDLA